MVFDNFISLGWFCGTAASMKKYGLRSFSGPFDWYFNDFYGVLSCIENRFEDFLLKDNLQETENPKSFLDTKYGFVFNHEIKRSLEEDYEIIKDKYNRRIIYFEKRIKERTCFIRTVRNPKELEYIEKNNDYISSIIKRDNIENEIVYLSLKSFNIPSGLQKAENIYLLNDDKYRGGREELDKLFDSVPEFLQWCEQHSDKQMRRKNQDFGVKI